MISIIIPLYNKEDTIHKTLASIFGQTYKDLEVIVVDDGSDDKSMKKPNKYKKKITLLEQKHKGANAARNLGAKKAKGDFLFFCDADIVLRPDALEELKRILDKNKNASYAYGSFIRGWKKMESRQFDEIELKQRNYISTMSLIRRADFPGFDESLKKFQDWDLWLTMLEQGKKGVFLPKVLFRSYTDKKGISQWYPRIFYKIPWNKMKIKIKGLENYEKAREIIRKKHKL